MKTFIKLLLIFSSFLCACQERRVLISTPTQCVLGEEIIINQRIYKVVDYQPKNTLAKHKKFYFKCEVTNKIKKIKMILYVCADISNSHLKYYIKVLTAIIN